jgi:hypothetical protein
MVRLFVISFIFEIFISQQKCVFFRASKKRKVFSEPILYEASQEKASGVMTFSDYSQFDMYQQKETELTQLGLTQDEVELKMVDCGLLSKVCK